MAKIPLGPWPLGMNNREDEYSRVFQPGGEQPPQLVEGYDVDISAEGWPSRRAGSTERLTGAALNYIASSGGILYAQDGSFLYKITPGSPYTTTLLASGLSTTVPIASIHEWGGMTFYNNGTDRGKILSDGTYLPWGLATAPSPTLGTAAGSLEAGRYRVAATLVNANDKTRAGDTIAFEGGANKASAVSVNGSQSITATLTPGDSNATHVNFYISTVNGDELFFAKQVAVGSLPATITDARVSKRPLRTQFMRPPILGDGIFSYKGFVFIWRDNWVFRSKGQTPNLFYPKQEVLGFPWDVRAGAGLEDGFYVATAGGLYWIGGGEPNEWQQERKTKYDYAQGTLVLEASKLPGLSNRPELNLRANTLVALFASEFGLEVGLPGGRIIQITNERLVLSSTPTAAYFVYREAGELRQILMLLP